VYEYPLSVLCFDFVDGFPISKEGHDKVLTITCKTTKYVRFLVGKETWTAEDWAEEYFKKIYCDRGFPDIIISDRNILPWLPRLLEPFAS
jgi:hypothetical protein